jgi:uncharacterized membrane protein
MLKGTSTRHQIGFFTCLAGMVSMGIGNAAPGLWPLPFYGLGIVLVGLGFLSGYRK